jgi:hypothetical protein
MYLDTIYSLVTSKFKEILGNFHEMKRVYLLISATSISITDRMGVRPLIFFSRSQMIRSRGKGDGGEQAGGRRRKRPSLLAWNGGKRCRLRSRSLALLAR